MDDRTISDLLGTGNFPEACPFPGEMTPALFRCRPEAYSNIKRIGHQNRIGGITPRAVKGGKNRRDLTGLFNEQDLQDRVGFDFDAIESLDPVIDPLEVRMNASAPDRSGLRPYGMAVSFIFSQIPARS